MTYDLAPKKCPANGMRSEGSQSRQCGSVKRARAMEVVTATVRDQDGPPWREELGSMAAVHPVPLAPLAPPGTSPSSGEARRLMKVTPRVPMTGNEIGATRLSGRV